MTRITLTAAAFLIACNSAFAGSDNFGSTNGDHPRTAATDNIRTTSIEKTDTAGQKPALPGSNRDLFGR
ncbi:DUF680 domain-containing protein [Mesorhizobium sp. ES1-1]|uniref:DUF680 domain-containing protein n=1 Tax=Mesorhizobium sp. ES1-1 TaxID=2876629 RepID=UPI001CCCC185|nr:DUF680 domain-containing protein [Mesorhizobium sp. ES1-1]MBZ9675632.1 DUF680 domain-containing protein [Mesorhizobium sp. ES1-1]